MANDTGGYGLLPVRKRNGATNWNTERCYIHALDATSLFIGDPVIYTATLANMNAAGTHKTVIPSAGTNGVLIYGVVVAIEPNPNNLNLMYSPASTEGWCHVCTDPDVLYKIRDNGAGTPLKSWVGANAEMVATASGNTANGVSGFELNAATVATTVTFPLHIEQIFEKEDNTLGDNVEYLVSLNTHDLAAGKRLGILNA